MNRHEQWRQDALAIRLDHLQELGAVADWYRSRPSQRTRWHIVVPGQTSVTMGTREAEMFVLGADAVLKLRSNTIDPDGVGKETPC